MLKTHLAIALMFGLIFFRAVENNIIFIPILLIAAMLPDIDTAKSYIGKGWYLRPVQWFLKHRGMIHSLTFCILASFLISFAWTPAAFPFFLGYSSHLLADGITREGITAFWPLKGEMSWKIRTGGRTEILILLVVLFADFLLVLSFFV